jgi:hypothetical protein
MSEKFDKEIERSIVENEKQMELINGKFNYVFSQSYADSKQADAAMNALGDSKGESAIHDALKFSPAEFGALPESEALAARALEQRALLPGLFAQYRALRDENDALRTTQQNRAARATEIGTKPADRQQLQQYVKDKQKEIAGKDKTKTRATELETEWEPDD